MIAACPTCGARYRIDTAKLRPEGARLRCSRCQSVFRVRAPAPSEQEGSEERRPAPPAAAATPPAPALPPAPPAAPPARPVRVEAPAPPRSEPPPEEVDRERLVLVAHAEPQAGKAIADAVASWGLRVRLVHDGVEAILDIQRSLPRVVVLDAALPKMFGFQVCELMKRNESLRRIHVILIGAIHDRDRYRRPPGDLYGADAYVEPHQLPDGLLPLLERFGMPLRGAGGEAPARPAAPEPPPAAPPVAAPASEAAPAHAPPAQAGAPPPASDPALAAELAQADRLARIIVSDIVLYNPEKFEAGLRAGNVVEALAAELAEGHSLLAQRVDPRIGDPDEFLHRELIRVARSRGMEES